MLNFHYRNFLLSSELAPEPKGKTVGGGGDWAGAEAGRKHEEVKKKRPSFSTVATAVKTTDWNRLFGFKSVRQHFLSKHRRFACCKNCKTRRQRLQIHPRLQAPLTCSSSHEEWFSALNSWTRKGPYFIIGMVCRSCTGSTDALTFLLFLGPQWLCVKNLGLLWYRKH